MPNSRIVRNYQEDRRRSKENQRSKRWSSKRSNIVRSQIGEGVERKDKTLIFYFNIGVQNNSSLISSNCEEKGDRDDKKKEKETVGLQWKCKGEGGVVKEDDQSQIGLQWNAIVSGKTERQPFKQDIGGSQCPDLIPLHNDDNFHGNSLQCKMKYRNRTLETGE